MAIPLTFAKYCELVVARLYEIEQDGNAPQADVVELMSDLEGAVPDAWPWEAAGHLVDTGLAHDFRSLGSPEIALNARGRLLAESGAGVIGNYQKSPQIVFTVGDGNQIAVGHGQHVTQTIEGDFSKEDVAELLDQAETTLQTDTTLSDPERDDALADVASMRAQIAKSAPNRHVLATLATGLGSIASLTDIADKLLHLLG